MNAAVRKLILCLTLFLFFSAYFINAQSTFNLKSAPPDLNVFLNGVLLNPVSVSSDGLRTYIINNAGTIRFGAEGYQSISYHSYLLQTRNNIVGIKLENTAGRLRQISEYATGIQPKSVYFSPEGDRLFVPLLGQHGIDVFRQRGQYLQYEKRLVVPGSSASGFVEAMCDVRRRELWVSNMEENKLHIFDLDTLVYKLSIPAEGIFPKVITQSPDGNLTAVSNWLSMDISIFDSNTKRLLHKIPVGGTPRGMAFSPDSSLLYITIYDEPVIAVINMSLNRVTSRFRLYSGAGAARHIIYRDGKLYVSDMLRGTVNILDASTGTLLRSRRVGPNLNTIVLSPDGQHIFASSRGSNNPADYTRPGPDFGAIYMLNTDDLTIQERVWGKNQPTGLAISPDGRFVVFTNFLDANMEFYRLD
ncbi:MAG: YncE family protein [Treponema sp.]|nr:YncE family protein [Treponema sp.]